MDPDQTAPNELSDLGTYCLQYRQQTRGADDKSREWRDEVNLILV